jgi:hypothetical protein
MHGRALRLALHYRWRGQKVIITEVHFGLVQRLTRQKTIFLL